MSSQNLIDFEGLAKSWFTPDFTKTEEQRAYEEYEKTKDIIPFHLGDKVTIIFPETYTNKKMIKDLYNKVFTIIDIRLSYRIENPLDYILDTGIKLCRFEAKHLKMYIK